LEVPLSTHRALVIDDSRTQAAIISRMLVERGWVAFSTDSVETAIEDFARQPIDLAMLDIHLAAGSGLAGVGKLKGTWPRVAITAMSAQGEASLSNAQAADVDFILRKPFNEMTLAEVLNDARVMAAGGRRRPHVLVIDDSATIRKIAAVTAREAGLRPTVLESAEEALERLVWDKVDAVLTDIFMPGLGGIEGIQRMRTIQPTLAIVAMSGGLGNDMSFEGALLAARKIGADRALSKPFRAEALGVAVRAALIDRQTMPPEAPRAVA
jgi:CheY-like chemotaxis protein